MTAGDDLPLVLGNLDCEASWGRRVLPRRVLARISAAATLLRFLFDEPIALWTPAEVAAHRMIALDDHPAPRLQTGASPRAAAAAWGAFSDRPLAPPRDLRGISVPTTLAVARQVNDRRFAAALEQQLAVAPAGARTIGSVAELAQHLAQGGAEDSPTQQWICKAPLSAAGRDRVLGQGPLAGETERAVARLLQRGHALVFEPWLARVADLGVCGVVRPQQVELRPPHTLLTSERGGFLGISTAPPPLSTAQRALLTSTVEAVGRALGAAGYLGPFAVDAFLHRRRSGEVALRPLCEINGRLSFGWVAAALAERFGARELGFSAAPPPGATVLVAAADDDVAAWIR